MILTVLAGLVALGGLFLNGAAVIIGGMVISPCRNLSVPALFSWRMGV
ncbi:MAG: hypothetical protein WC294_06920 [Methanoregula sp.]